MSSCVSSATNMTSKVISALWGVRSLRCSPSVPPSLCRGHASGAETVLRQISAKPAASGRKRGVCVSPGLVWTGSLISLWEYWGEPVVGWAVCETESLQPRNIHRWKISFCQITAIIYVTQFLRPQQILTLFFHPNKEQICSWNKVTWRRMCWVETYEWFKIRFHSLL